MAQSMKKPETRIKARELTWELASGKPPIEGMRLERVMAYYHNDREKGFAVGLDGRSPDVDLEQIMLRAFHAYKQAWDLADDDKRDEYLAGYAAQLDQAAGHRGWSNQKALLVIMNVLWLSSYGRMPNDEYNGVQYIWGAGALPWVNHE